MLFEKLPEKDIEAFMAYVKSNGPNPDSSIYGRQVDAKDLLRFWEESKSQYLYDLFGQRFILQKEVEYFESSSKIVYKLNESQTCGKMSNFYHKYMDKVNEDYKDWEIVHKFLYLIGTGTLQCNKIVGIEAEGWSLPVSKDKFVKVYNDGKPMKALAKIAKIWDLEAEFEEFRLEHSRILNQKALKGNLSLSIHPLDYVTMSDNRNKWHTCMSWEDSGSYRAGTVEMMNSPMIVVAYLTSPSKTFTWGWNYQHQWNSKIWRCLILVHPDGIVSIKGYPHTNEKLAIQCVEWLRELGIKNLNWDLPYEASPIPDTSDFEYKDGQIHYMEHTTDYHAMYNDFDTVTHFGTLRPATKKSVFAHNYCGNSMCMCCGKKDPDLYDESFVFCSDCCDDPEDEEHCYCSWCGGHEYYEDVYVMNNGDYLCSSCYHEHGFYCRVTDDYCYNEDKLTLYIASEKDNPTLEDLSMPVFEGIRYNRYRYWFKDDIKDFTNEDGEILFYVNKEDLTDEAFRCLFDSKLRAPEERDQYFKY